MHQKLKTPLPPSPPPPKLKYKKMMINATRILKDIALNYSNQNVIHTYSVYIQVGSINRYVQVPKNTSVK